MKTFSKIVIGTVAGVGIALTAAAFAQGPGFGHGPGGYGHAMGMHGPGGFGPGGGMHGPQGFGGTGMVDTKLDAIKSDLKLTDDQTKAWEAFEKSVRNQVQSMHEGRTAMRSGGQNPDAHIAFMEQRLVGMKAVQKARTDLYAVLTPDQKSVIDRYGFHGPRH
jgi:Spy/CpxP family protein refolding chaperone